MALAERKPGPPWLALTVAALLVALPAAAGRAQAETAAQVRAAATTIVLLDAHNQPLDPERHVLGISRHITHDRTLPRSIAAEVQSADSESFRIEFSATEEQRRVVYARLESLTAKGERHGLLRHVPLARVGGSARFRSQFLRLVSDATDVSAPDVGDQVLRAQLGDRVHIVVGAAVAGPSVAYAVGSSVRYDEARSPLEGTLHLSVLRIGVGGPPAVGDDVNQALTLARRQVEIANEIWAQCFITFGAPTSASVRVVDPPPPALLSIADLDGFPTSGVARISFRANDKRIGPLEVPKGATPERTASSIARALRATGFSAHVTTNPRAELGADASADVVARDGRGELVTLSVDGDQRISSDPQQKIAIGTVDLSDGVDEFDNTLAATGTLEERTLVKLLADDDPSTIDVFLVNRFVNRARQGEAFIEADGSSMANTLIFDRNAVRFERQAWVQAHELGHILLDEAFHPDNIGVDRPWLLMDADARQGRVVGPKRVSDEECRKARRRSGPAAHPPLLRFTPQK
jgi:hypothetical protein